MRIRQNAEIIEEQLKFGILDIAAYGDERALGSRTYFQRKISFLQHLGNNDFPRAEEYLDEADSYSCVGGSEFDRGAFEAYKSEAR